MLQGTTGSAPDDIYKEAAFCSKRCLKSCSNYFSKVDEYNEQVHGIEKKDYSELLERLVTPGALSFRALCERVGAMLRGTTSQRYASLR